ncbi:MAG: NADP-dependent malic enzyme [Candidatus Kaiserbacteria bacterium]|nr:NADP-dependent malic enzyme [Candidatus Kaiserbacteria bacterium]
MDRSDEAIRAHREHHGKIETGLKMAVQTMDDLSLAYTPGVAAVCQEIQKNPKIAQSLTIKANTVAVVTDGSAVLGLGNIGAEASLPVMEGKALLLKRFADVDAFPICLNTQDPHEIIETVKRIAPVFGGINLEDIAAPNCFTVERELQGIGIPVFHDDQHGTAITTLAALINASIVAQKDLTAMTIVIAGAGAAGTAIANLLASSAFSDAFDSPRDILICDSTGIIHTGRDRLTDHKKELAAITNASKKSGTLSDALHGSDVFIGVSQGGIVSKEMVQTMGDRPIIFAMANPTPEILPEEAQSSGAYVVGTGRSDYKNQINNVLAFPGIFRGALAGGVVEITTAMKVRAIAALASVCKDPSPDYIIPDVFDPAVVPAVAQAVQNNP